MMIDFSPTCILCDCYLDASSVSAVTLLIKHRRNLDKRESLSTDDESTLC